MSDMTPQQAADKLAQGFPGRALRVLIDHARAAAPEGGDLAFVVWSTDVPGGVRARRSEHANWEAASAEAHRLTRVGDVYSAWVQSPAPSVAAPPREDEAPPSRNIAAEALARVVRTLDVTDEEHDGPITAQVDTDVIRAAIVNGPDDLDSFVLRSTTEQIVRALTSAPRTVRDPERAT